jgi:hypothetical protein
VGTFSVPKLFPQESPKRKNNNYAVGLATSVHSRFSQIAAGLNSHLKGVGHGLILTFDSTVRNHVHITDFHQRRFRRVAGLKQF